MQIDPSRFADPAGPWLHELVAPASAAHDALEGLRHSSTAPLVTRIVRGRKSVTKAAFLDEISAALQFPPYFGSNWDALHDCLGDLAWLDAAIVVVGIMDSGSLLAGAPASDLDAFFQVAQSAARSLATHANPAVRRPRSLHVVLHCQAAERDACHARWQAVGVTPTALA